MPSLRTTVWSLFMVGLVIAALRSIRYNDTATLAWHSFGSVTIGSGFAGVNCYLEDGDRAKDYPFGFSKSLGCVIRGDSSYSGGSNQNKAIGLNGGWTRLFTAFPSIYFEDEEIVFGISYGWLISGLGLVWFFRHRHKVRITKQKKANNTQ